MTRARHRSSSSVLIDQDALVTMSRATVLHRDRTTYWTKLLQSTLTSVAGQVTCIVSGGPTRSRRATAMCDDDDDDDVFGSLDQSVFPISVAGVVT